MAWRVLMPAVEGMNMSKPIILISIGKERFGADFNAIQMVSATCPLDYVNAVTRAGGVPLLLPRMGEMDAVRAAAEAAHGVLFTGGGDIIPLNYGEEPHPTVREPDAVRDEMELALARITSELRLPVLGICRGIQLLNVAGGGTLIQDIPSQIPHHIQHCPPGPQGSFPHTVDVDPETLLAMVLGTTSLRVNSWHHQALKAVGLGLQVTARAKDGIAEGLEATDGRRLLAVQWHPEETAGEDEHSKALFEWLVDEARRYQEQTPDDRRAAIRLQKSVGALRELAQSDPAESMLETSGVIRLANAIITEAIAQSVGEIHLETCSSGVRVIYALRGTLHEAMTMPRHIQKSLFDRYRRMAAMESLDDSLQPLEGAFAIKHNGRTYQINARYVVSPVGESIALRLEI